MRPSLRGKAAARQFNQSLQGVTFHTDLLARYVYWKGGDEELNRLPHMTQRAFTTRYLKKGRVCAPATNEEPLCP